MKKNEDIGLCISVMIRPHKDKNKRYLTVSLVNTNLASTEKFLNKCFFKAIFLFMQKIILTNFSFF